MICKVPASLTRMDRVPTSLAVIRLDRQSSCLLSRVPTSLAVIRRDRVPAGPCSDNRCCGRGTLSCLELLMEINKVLLRH